MKESSREGQDFEGEEKVEKSLYENDSLKNVAIRIVQTFISSEGDFISYKLTSFLFLTTI